MDGILVIDKPKDMTSRDVVNIIGKEFKTKKIGHTGTLDPNATGVLVLCMGSALKLVELLTSSDKVYQAEIILGISTDTYDITGTIDKKEEISFVDAAKLKNVLNSFVGKIMQEVPIYSSVKVNGKKLYEYARNNEEVKLPKRLVEIFALEIISDPIYKEGMVHFNIVAHVSKGTYIRSLAKDIGLKLGVPSCMGDLRRIKQGSFDIKDASSLEEIKEGTYKLISLKEALKDKKTIKVSDDIAKKVKYGQILPRFCAEDLCVIADKDDNILAIYQTYDKDKKMMKPYKMF